FFKSICVYLYAVDLHFGKHRYEGHLYIFKKLPKSLFLELLFGLLTHEKDKEGFFRGEGLISAVVLKKTYLAVSALFQLGLKSDEHPLFQRIGAVCGGKQIFRHGC